jgi:hypothetical protein
MSSILFGTFPLLAVIFVILIGRFLLTGICLKKRYELLRFLESDAPELYQALGAPSFTIRQQLFRRRDCLANNRLWFYALFRAGIFPDQPRVHAALVGYQRVEIVGLGFFAFVLIVGVLFIYSVCR